MKICHSFVLIADIENLVFDLEEIHQQICTVKFLENQTLRIGLDQELLPGEGVCLRLQRRCCPRARCSFFFVYSVSENPRFSCHIFFDTIWRKNVTFEKFLLFNTIKRTLRSKISRAHTFENSWDFANCNLSDAHQNEPLVNHQQKCLINGICCIFFTWSRNYLSPVIPKKLKKVLRNWIEGRLNAKNVIL